MTTYRRPDHATTCGALILALCSFCTLSMPCASGEEPVAQPQSAPSSNKLPAHRKADDTKEWSAGEMLSALRDVRLSLGQVKQQSVNLFLEATRTETTTKSPVLMASPTTINVSMLSNKPKFYQAPRKEWLVFYVNTLEPIIRLLTDDVEDVDKGEQVAPKAIEAQILPLWNTWKKDVNAIKSSLDKVQELIEPDKDTNVALADQAVSIFKSAEHLEKTRYKVYRVFQQHYLSEERAQTSRR